MARHKGYHTDELIFPSNWTGKWLYRAIVNTPKWQINSVLGSPKYNEWINILSANLNGLRLLAKTDDAVVNVMRSVAVGVKVHQASQQYEQLFHKLPYEQSLKQLENILRHPVVGDMVRTLTEATLPSPQVGVTEEKKVIMPPIEEVEEKESVTEVVPKNKMIREAVL